MAVDDLYEDLSGYEAEDPLDAATYEPDEAPQAPPAAPEQQQQHFSHRRHSGSSTAQAADQKPHPHSQQQEHHHRLPLPVRNPSSSSLRARPIVPRRERPPVVGYQARDLAVDYPTLLTYADFVSAPYGRLPPTSWPVPPPLPPPRAPARDRSRSHPPSRHAVTAPPPPPPTMPEVPRPGPAKLSSGAGLDEWLEEAKQCHYLPEPVMKQLCEMVKEVLMEESNIQPVSTPVTICGDIHGQFYDLLELFRVAGGMPGETNVQAPTTATTVITSDDIEPPTEITNPKLKKKIKSTEASGDEDNDDDESPAGDSAQDESAAAAAAAADRPPSAAGSGGDTSSQSADTRFVFLGDFVDRGYFSLETFTLLMCLKAKYPDRIVLVRGNHESRQITQVYGFYEECQAKYGNASVWKACCQVFDFLVLAAIVDGTVLCVHGGLSPEIRTIDQIRVVARAQEIPHEGAFCDLVWSDPEDIDTWAVSPRGAGWLFGDKVATEFNHVNGLKTIARAHQLVNEGYKFHFAEKSVVTVWSAPNYCYRCGNVASIMTVDKDLNSKFSIFSAVSDENRHVPGNRRGPSDYFL